MPISKALKYKYAINFFQTPLFVVMIGCGRMVVIFLPSSLSVPRRSSENEF